jgi:CRISPR/Cas system-associated protein Cas7 (RAMP superfamily)
MADQLLAELSIDSASKLYGFTQIFDTNYLDVSRRTSEADRLAELERKKEERRLKIEALKQQRRANQQ